MLMTPTCVSAYSGVSASSAPQSPLHILSSQHHLVICDLCALSGSLWAAQLPESLSSFPCYSSLPGTQEECCQCLEMNTNESLVPASQSMFTSGMYRHDPLSHLRHVLSFYLFILRYVYLFHLVASGLSCGTWDLLLRVYRLLSSHAVRRSRAHGLSSCGTRASLLWCGILVPWPGIKSASPLHCIGDS